MGRTVELLASQGAEAYGELLRLLDGLTEAEFYWEPVSSCWTVFHRADGTWDYDYELPDPRPSPFTTIAWRVNHLATCKVMYHEHAFGAGGLTWDTLETPGTVEGTLAMLREGERLLQDDLAALDDEDLDRSVRTNWGATWPAWRIFTTMIDHDRHHGGEIGVLRDLHRAFVEGTLTPGAAPLAP